MGDIRWSATYEDSSQTWFGEPQAWSRVKRDRPYIFTLEADDGTELGCWMVEKDMRLLYCVRNAVTGEQHQRWVLIGLEDRATGQVLVRRYSLQGERWICEQRESWGVEGEQGYAEWRRPMDPELEVARG